MLGKMYLVSPDYLGITTTTSTQPPHAMMIRRPPGAAKKRPVQTKKTKKKTKKDTVTQAYDKWVKLRAQLHEADVQRERQINTIADLLKKVLPSSMFDQNLKPKLDALRSGTQTELLLSPPPTPAKRHIVFETPKRAPTARSEPYAFPSTSSEVIYETTTPPPIEIGDDDDDDAVDVGTDDPQISPQV
jgi:hypothetical protein